MMINVKHITQSVPYDDTVTHLEWHTHLPYASMTLNNSDEIRIPIQQHDICVLPYMSYLYVEGKLVLSSNDTAPKKTRFTNNAFAYLFDEIRYELNGVEVDRVRNPGITSTLKGYTSFNEQTLKCMGNAGWIEDSSLAENPLDSSTVDASGNFSFCVPLSSLMGFAEDFRDMIVNARHELVLIRSASDKNAVLWQAGAPEGNTPTVDTNVELIKVKLEKLCWRIPYVTLSYTQQIDLMKIQSNNTLLPVEFRSWELYERPSIPKASKHSWTVKTASQLEKPRYVIVGFQTNRRNNMKQNAAHFDHCNLTNLKLHLNSLSYPYDDLKLDFKKNHSALLYDMYARFQESYYHTQPQPLLNKKHFEKHAPLVVIDCSHQNESIKSGPVDVRLEIETSEDFPDNTTAYCLIIHDKAFSYNPSDNMVVPRM